MQRLAFVALAAALVAGCGGERPPTSPTSPGAPVPSGPSALISDGARGAGNPDFFFLKPLLPDPAAHPNFDAGKFNGGYAPIVQICVLQNGAIVDVNNDKLCDPATVHAQFSGAAVTVSPTGEFYQANWKTDQPPLALDKFYRVRVLLGNVELGFADVDPVTRAEMKNAETGEAIPLLEGRTLPIKFRIENGVLSSGNGTTTEFVEQRVPNAGGTVLTPTAHAGAAFPSGWLDGVTLNGQPVTEVLVTIERLTVGPTNNCHTLQPTPGLIQLEGCFQYRTIPDLGAQQFGAPVVVALCPEITEDDPRYEALRLYKSDVDEPVTLLAPAIPPFLLDCDEFAPTQVGSAAGALDRVGAGLRQVAARVGGFFLPRSAYAVDLGLGGVVDQFSNVGFAIERYVAVTGVVPPTVGAAPGTVVPASAFVFGLHEDSPTSVDSVPLAGEAVTFSAPGGVVTTGTATTLADGSAPFAWTLVPGINTLTATVVGFDDPTGGLVTNSSTATIQLSAGCGAPLGLRSANSNTGVGYTFTNPSSNQAVTAYWINFAGQLTSYGTIPSGGSLQVATYLTHPWIFQTAAGECAGGVFDPSINGGTYVIPQIAPTAPVITSLVLGSSTIAIGGSTGYTATILNPLNNAAYAGLSVQGYVVQGPAERAAGGILLQCTTTPGDLLPGSCTQQFTVNPSNDNTGTGTLAPGAAAFRLELRGPNNQVLTSTTVPITLVPFVT